MTKFLKTSWVILRNVTVIFIVLELLLAGIYTYKASNEYDDFIALKVESNVHENMSSQEVEALYYEYIDTEMEWTPYVHYRPKPYKGTYNNINENGLRKTAKHSPVDDTAVAIKIFCFGGSTMYGIGSSDEATIPSLLSDILAQKFPHKSFEITNFGVLGYNRDQESLQLKNEILKNNTPNIAIFFDGVNEVFAAYQNKTVGMPTNTVNRHLEFNTRTSYFKRISLFFEASYTQKLIVYLRKKLGSVKKENEDISDLAEATANNYRNQIIYGNFVSKHYNISVINILQPTIFTKKVLSPYEKIMKKNEAYVENLYNQTYFAIQNDSTLSSLSNFSNMTSVFNLATETVYTDFCHTSAKGNRIIAEAMYEQIKLKLIESEVQDSTKIENK